MADLCAGGKCLIPPLSKKFFSQSWHTKRLQMLLGRAVGTRPIRKFGTTELQQVGIFFALNFLPWDFLLIKKLEIGKTKTTKYTTFKTDIIKVVLVFLISNFFTNKNSQGRKLSLV